MPMKCPCSQAVSVWASELPLRQVKTFGGDAQKGNLGSRSVAGWAPLVLQVEIIGKATWGTAGRVRRKGRGWWWSLWEHRQFDDAKQPGGGRNGSRWLSQRGCSVNYLRLKGMLTECVHWLNQFVEAHGRTHGVFLWCWVGMGLTVMCWFMDECCGDGKPCAIYLICSVVLKGRCRVE